MSSGSYFTIYRKHTKQRASDDALAKLRDEYRTANKSSFSTSTGKSLDDFPVLMQASFKGSSQELDDECSTTFYDKDGYVHDKLLEFHFGSSFTCLKEKFRTNAYVFSESALLISKSEAEKMLQAVEYILSEKYSKEFESILRNEYVEVFGDGLSTFDSRFKPDAKYVYIDKSSDGWTASFGDDGWNREIAESDNDILFNLRRVKSCIQAFLDAESYEWNGEELVLEYSTY